MFTSCMIPLFFGLRGGQLIFVVLVVLLLFGASRIPSIMRNLGKGVHQFKQGVEDAKAEMNKPVTKAESQTKETPWPVEPEQPKDRD